MGRLICGIDIKCAYLAGTLAFRLTLAIRFILEAVRRGLEMPLPKALEFEADMIVQVFSTEDAYERLKAFIEKRSPVFRGK